MTRVEEKWNMMDRGEPRQDEQTFFTGARVAEQLGVTARTVRKYIEQGIAGSAGTRITLGARRVATADGQHYQIGQRALDEFTEQCAQSVWEHLTDPQLHAFQVAAHEEHERLSDQVQYTLSTIEQQAVQIASQVQTIERLTVENGKLEGEKSLLRQQLAAAQERQPNRVARILRGVFGWRPALP